MERRSLLKFGVVTLGGAISGSLAALAGVFVRATSRWPLRSNTPWVALCRIADVKEGEPLAASFTVQRMEGWYRDQATRQVYVQRLSDGTPLVFSRRCTHLGCPVTWKSEKQQFRCACHGGVFARDGVVVEGPPARALEVLKSRLAGEMVEVEQV